LAKFAIYQKLDDRKRAVAELQRLIEAFPNQPDHRRMLAEYQRAIGDLNAALATYKSLLQRHPADADAQRALAELEGTGSAGAGRGYPFAGKLSDPTTPVDVKSAQIAPLLTPEALRADPGLRNLLPEWAANIEKAHPGDFNALTLSGKIYFALDRQDEALDRFRRCLKTNPRDFSVWDYALQILAAQKNFAEMERIADQAIDAFP
ncbi:MAG: tetratricopeptide repeat protein, partial [Saprospiraceae bacterium]